MQTPCETKQGVRSVDKKSGKEVPYDIEEKINFSVFPGLQGGPHNHTISGLACALKQAATPEFVAYQKQVRVRSVCGLCVDCVWVCAWAVDGWCWEALRGSNPTPRRKQD